MSQIGSLEETKLADVLRLFASGKKSGLLTVVSGKERAMVRFLKGEIIHAVSGRCLGEEAVVDLFGWHGGEITFVPEERQVTGNVTKAVEALIAEGLKLGERAHRLRELIPSDKVVFQMGPGPGDEQARITIGPAEWRVLRTLDGVREVREVIEASRVARAEVVRILFELADAGFLQRVEPSKALRVQAQGGLFGGDTAEVDERLEADWRKVARFVGGVERVEVRSVVGKHLALPVSFRAGLFRDIHLPRNAVAELAVRDGDEVTVRPVG